jgi:hypothetical protein
LSTKDSKRVKLFSSFLSSLVGAAISVAALFFIFFQKPIDKLLKVWYNIDVRKRGK